MLMSGPLPSCVQVEFEQLRQRDVIKEESFIRVGVSGLKWVDLGEKKPPNRKELTNQALSAELVNKVKNEENEVSFTEEEWVGFKVKSLDVRHIIKSKHPEPRFFEPTWGARCLRPTYKTDFSIEEWKEFKVSDLKMENYIEMNSRCFKPSNVIEQKPDRKINGKDRIQRITDICSFKLADEKRELARLSEGAGNIKYALFNFVLFNLVLPMAFLVPAILYGTLTAYFTYAIKEMPEGDFFVAENGFSEATQGVTAGWKQVAVKVPDLIIALYGYTFDCLLALRFAMPEMGIELPTDLDAWVRLGLMIQQFFGGLAEGMQAGLGLTHDDYMGGARQLTGTRLLWLEMFLSFCFEQVEELAKAFHVLL